MLIAALFVISACSTNNEQEPINNAPNTDNTQQEQDNMEDTMNDQPETDETSNTGEEKTFTLTGVNYDFIMNGEENPALTVNQGDTVTIIFESTDGFHDWVVDEFDAATEKVRPEDGTTQVTFVADQTGTFEYYCSVGSHRAQGMFGSLIVE